MGGQKSDTELLDAVLAVMSRHGWNADRGNVEGVSALAFDDIRQAQLREQVVHGLTSGACYVDTDTLKGMKECVAPAMGSVEAELDG